MRPGATPEVLVPMLTRVPRAGLALVHAPGRRRERAPADGPVVRASARSRCVAGRHDVLTSMHDIVDTAERIPHAQVTVLPGSHFLPLEYPELVAAALDELARRSDLQPPLAGVRAT